MLREQVLVQLVQVQPLLALPVLEQQRVQAPGLPAWEPEPE